MDTRRSPSARTLIAVPALNERHSIVAVIQELHTHYPEGDILVVDDGSIDGTASVAAAAGALILRLPFNLGVGGAMRAAYKFALRNGYQVVVQVDADGQHDPAYIETLVARLADADLVVGARFAGVGGYKTALPRRLAMRVLASVLSWQTGTHLTDVTSGFRAANERAIKLFASHYPSEYLGDTVESLVIASRTGCAVAQVPVEMRLRAYGNSSASSLRASVFLDRAFVALALSLVRTWPIPELDPVPEARKVVELACTPI